MRAALARAKRLLREGRVSGAAYRATAQLAARTQILVHEACRGRYYSGAHFDRLFAADADPWSYERDAVSEERKALLLSLLPRGPLPRLLEIGCGAGWITAGLAARSDTVIALDISQVALDLARARCAGHDNVEFRRFDLLDDALPGGFDVVMCAGVLVYLPWARQVQVRDRIVAALNPGAWLLLEHTRKAFPGECAGERIHALYAGHAGLKLAARERRDIYEVLVLRRA